MEEKLSIKLFVVLSKATKTITELIKEDIGNYDLNPSEFSVLELLYFKGDQPIQAIAKKVILTSGSMTYVIDKLETKGLIQRIPCEKDRRVIYASITNEGVSLFEEIFPKHEKVVAHIMEGLNKEEKEMAITLLKKLGLHAKNL